MRNLINFLIRYNYWLLFALLQAVSFSLLFTFNSYQGSAYFTSANLVSGFIYSCASHVTEYFGLRTVNSDLVQRNVELEMQVQRLKQELARYTADTTAITRLREEVLGGYTIYSAEVINNCITRSENYITLNRGSADGISPEMGVVCGNGVVGIVYRTSAHYSIVLSALNARSAISCKIKRTDYFGSLHWDGGSPRYAFVKDMPRHSEFSLGDTVVTSGHSAVFPEGIPVGVVDDMSDSQDGLSYLLKIRLFTDFARLSDVKVIASAGQDERTQLEKGVPEVKTK